MARCGRNVGPTRYDVRISSFAAAIIRKEGRRMDNHESLRPGLLPDGAGSGGPPHADLEWAQYVAWADREAAAGRGPEPEPWDPEPEDPDLAALVPGGHVPSAPARPLFAEDGV